MASREAAVPLSTAGPEQRFSLVWKYVQQLVMEDTTPIVDIERLLVHQQRQGVLRAIGLRMIRWLLRATTMNSARRELLAVVPVALAASPDEAERGVPARITVPGCGTAIQANIRYEPDHCAKTHVTSLLPMAALSLCGP